MSCLCVCSITKSCPTLLRIVAHRAPLSMGLPRQEYWSGLPFPYPGDLPNSGMEPRSPVSFALAGGLSTTEPPGSVSSCLIAGNSDLLKVPTILFSIMAVLFYIPTNSAKRVPSSPYLYPHLVFYCFFVSVFFFFFEGIIVILMGVNSRLPHELPVFLQP